MTALGTTCVQGPLTDDDWIDPHDGSGHGASTHSPLVDTLTTFDDLPQVSRNGSVIAVDGPGAPPELPTRRTDYRSLMSAPRLQHPQPTRRRHGVNRSPRSTRRTLLILTAVIALLFVVVAASVLTLLEKLGDNVSRVPDAFKGLDTTTRPAPAGGLTFLLMGTDTRSDSPTTGTGATASATGDRSDVIMIARLAPDGHSAAVVSIPRDSWVNIPGHGMNKINAAYAFGGPSLLINTVESVTALRIDHFAVVDFAGFRSVVDSVGGIDVGIAQATSNDGVDFYRGVNHLDGAQALAYVRQRYGLADGDLDRAQRQQNALRALLGKVAHTGALEDPIDLYQLLDSAGEFVSVDDTLSNDGLRSVAKRLRAVPPRSISYLRAPVAGLGREGPQSVVYLDTSKTASLWSALQHGTAADYAATHADDTLGAVTR